MIIKGLVNNIIKQAYLSKSYYEVLQQLSKLSLDSLNDNKLVLTLDEITAVYPDIAAIPEAINNFGLLPTIKHFGLT